MSQKKYSSKGRSFLAFLVMLGGAVLMMILVVSFNKSVKEKEQVVKKEVRQIKSAKTQKKASKPKPKPKSKPKKAQPKAPLPNMNSLLGGVAMNIPEFTTDNIAGDSNQLLEDIAEDAIMNENTVDVKPKVLSRPPLEYPADAAKNGIKGYVVINLLVGKDGSVELAKVLESQPVGVFDEAALNAVRTWRFSPAMYKAKPVKMWAKQKIRFQ
ncbi:TonB family protein [Sulfurimonas aquatica]|uniref:TonB family protein n=1 Tax=Sulfurimonas aquatica TaxID=2672570 RepID=A0A975B1Z6_9BACT|nr:energy transducer TonB [Sulfurimonas aquatica]QSZ42719.1 TonB family protein [Sulfurimonas aquatica]